MPDAVTQRELKSNLGGVGASVEYHSRDNASTRRGAALSADVTWYGQAVGGGSTFGKLELAGLFYTQPRRRWTLGARFDVRSAWGEVPFYDTPYLAMRGLPPRQFANDVVVLTEVEAHRALARRWTLGRLTRILSPEWSGLAIVRLSFSLDATREVERRVTELRTAAGRSGESRRRRTPLPSQHSCKADD